MMLYYYATGLVLVLAGLRARQRSAARPPPRRRFLCVYCGSRTGDDPVYAEQARRVGELLAKRGVGLVYGGGCKGLMGEVAKAVDKNHGTVISVIPKPLLKFCNPMIQPENAIVTNDMHSRKRCMVQLSDAFLALPGGIGTLEELLETSTWVQLGVHNKPVGALNIKSFFQPLREMYAHQISTGFLSEPDGMVHFDDDVERLLDHLLNPKVLKRGLTDDWDCL